MKRELEERKNKFLEEANKEQENQGDEEDLLNNTMDNAIDLAAELNPSAKGVPTPQSVATTTNKQVGKKPYPGKLVASQISQPSNVIHTADPRTPA